MKLSSTRRKILSVTTSGLAAVGMIQTAGAQNESQNSTSDGNTTAAENTNNTEVETDSGGNTSSPDDEANNTSDGDQTENQTESENSDNGSSGACTGAPTMSRTSITTPQKTITAETPATVEANFRVDPTVPEECTVHIDLQYSFAQSGFQFGGGSGWQQSATDIVATTFDDLQAGDIESIDAQIHTNGAEVGDEVTVIADYEIWYEGNRDESFQQSGIRETVDVEAINEPDTEETETDEDGGDSEEDTDDTEITIPGFGVPSSIAAVGSVGYMIKRRVTSDD